MRVYAHRGSSLLWPENTMLAFDRAHAVGATGFETDLRLAGDGTLVLAHDPDLGRFGRPDVRIGERSAAELARCAVRSPDGRLEDGVPTLERLLRAYPEKDYIFDLKEDAPALFGALRALLDRLSLHDRVWFLTWSARADRELARTFPDRVQFPGYHRSAAWAVATLLGLGRLLEPGGRLVALPASHRGRRLFSPELVRALGARGKTFVGYLVNEPEDIAWARACGVEIVLTDRPDRWLG